jgi:hypothetical protein
MLLFVLVFVIAGSFSTLAVVLCGYLLYSFIDDVIFPMDSMLTNILIEPKKRATVLSMKTVIENLSAIIG